MCFYLSNFVFSYNHGRGSKYMTGVIPGAAVDLLSFGQDNTVSLPPSFPPVCFLLFSLASCIPFLSTLSYNYHMHSLLSLCVTVTKFHFFKIEIRCLLKWGEIFFFFSFFKCWDISRILFFLMFPPQNPSVWERVGNGNHVAWDAGFFVYYIKRM